MAWFSLTDRRVGVADQLVHQHEADLVFGVEYAEQPGIIECPRCSAKTPRWPPERPPECAPKQARQ